MEIVFYRTPMKTQFELSFLLTNNLLAKADIFLVLYLLLVLYPNLPMDNENSGILLQTRNDKSTDYFKSSLMCLESLPASYFTNRYITEIGKILYIGINF